MLNKVTAKHAIFISAPCHCGYGWKYHTRAQQIECHDTYTLSKRANKNNS